MPDLPLLFITIILLIVDTFFVYYILFKQKKGQLTIILCAINILVFLYVFFGEIFNTLDYTRIVTTYGLSMSNMATRPYVIITSMFLHASFSHLLLNMLGLLAFGSILETEYGSVRLITTYLVSGIIGGIFFVVTMGANDIAIGASGAIFGLLGFLTLLSPGKLAVLPLPIPLPIALQSIIYIIFFIPLAASTSGGVAVNAHFGGLFAGGGLALLARPEQAKMGLLSMLILILLLLLLSPLLASYL